MWKQQGKTQYLSLKDAVWFSNVDTKALWNKLSTHSPEISTKSTALLKSLSKHLIFADVIIADRTASKFHGLFKVISSDLGNRIFIFHFLQPSKDALSVRVAQRTNSVSNVNLTQSCIGNHMISSAIWNKQARVHFSKTNETARACRASAICGL